MSPGPEAPTTSRSAFWLLVSIACVYVLIECVLILGNSGAFGIPRFRALAYEYLGFWPGLLENWRSNYAIQPALMFLTYGFLHTGVIHLIVNMITLVSLGRALLKRISILQFLLLYSASILGGAAGFALLSETYRPMVGASGALFGLAGAFLAWEYVDRFAYQERLWPVARAVVFLIALNVLLYFAMNRLLAWEAHLGGFVTGWIVALLIDPRGRITDDEAPPRS